MRACVCLRERGCVGANLPMLFQAHVAATIGSRIVENTSAVSYIVICALSSVVLVYILRLCCSLNLAMDLGADVSIFAFLDNL